MADRKESVKSIEDTTERRRSSVVHIDEVSADAKEEVRQVTNLTAKEQYKKLWAAIKSEKRFCWWTLYTMLLVFAW